MTRARIVEQAESLFMAKGIRDTSIGDIAAALGISKGTLFYHFKSKDDLIREIAFAHIQRFGEGILAFIERGKGSLDLRSILERFLGELLGTVLRNRLHLYLIEEGVCRNGELKAELRAKYKEWQALVVGAIEPYMGERAAALGPALVALADGLIIQSALDVELPPVAGMVDALFPAR